MRKLPLAMAVMGPLVLTACLNDDNNNHKRSVEASPSLGLVQHATVNFYQADGTTEIGTADTGDSGVVTVPAGSYTGPVIVEVLGDDVDAMYFDEALGTMLSFPAGRSLHAILPSPSSAGVTPLTELAYQAAVRQNLLPISVAATNEINNIVGAALAPGLTSILSVPAMLGDPTVTSLDDSEAGNYALILAALAELGVSDPSGAPALAVLSALVADLTDGVIDGTDNGSPIVGVPYSNFLSDMASALSTAAVDYTYSGTASSQAPISSSVDTSSVSNPSTNTGNSGSLVCNSVSATLNSALANTYELSYSRSQPGGPFTEAQAVTAVVNSNGTLQINGMTLSAPQFCVFSGETNTAEIIWADADNKIEYALSNNDTGEFNEINVGDAAHPRNFADTQLPAFLGQLTPVSTNTSGPAAIRALGGNYSPAIVRKSGDFTSSYNLASPLSVAIDGSTGVVTVDGQYVFDPADASYMFTDRSTNSVPRYQIESTDGDGVKWSYEVYVEDGTVLGHLLKRSEQGVSASEVEASEEPLPQNIKNFFAAAKDLAQPLSLTLVNDDATYNSGYEGDGKCGELMLSSNDGSSASNSDRSVPFQMKVMAPGSSSFDYNFFRSTGRYAEEGTDKSLIFAKTGVRLILRGDGYVDLETVFIGNVKDRATNDPAQISAAGCTVPGSDPEQNNVGKSRLSGNGISADVNGMEYTYNGIMVLFPNNSGDGIAHFDAKKTNDDTTIWRIFVPETVGSYNCAETAEQTVLQHIQNGGAGADSGSGTGAGSCVIKLLQAGPIYEAYFTGMLEGNAGEALKPVRNGYFYYDPTPAGSGDGTLPAGSNGATISVTEAGGSLQQGDNFLADTVVSGLTRPGQQYANFSGEGVSFFQFLGLPLTTGSFDCGSVPPGQFQEISMSLNFTYASSNAGSTCTIVVSSNASNVFEGSYTATLFPGGGDTDSVSISGEFRFPGAE